MRSPSGARFPSRLMALLCAASLAACTNGGETAPDARPRPAVDGPHNETGSPPDDERSTGERQTSKESVVLTDGDSKRTVRGDAPRYVEIQSAQVAASPEELSLVMTLDGSLPARMPDDHSVLRVSFMLTMKDGRRFTFDAQCVRAGWGAFAAGGPEDAPTPDLGMSDHGGSLSLHVDPAYIGGIQPFDWIASVAWTSGAANYAFDSAPKSGSASFP